MATPSAPLKVGILSDTHGRLSIAAYNALAGCDYLIHAGDICSIEIFHELAALAPLYAVLGNNDIDEYPPDASGARPSRFARPVIGGVGFLVAHYPREVNGAGIVSGAVAEGEKVPRILVHGHTHVPRLERGAAVAPAELLVCPGSTTRPRKGSPASVAFVELQDGAIIKAYHEFLA